MIKKELYLESGSGRAKEQKVGELTMDQVIKISQAKSESTLALTPKSHVKEILGTCVTMGVMVDGKDPRDVQKEVDAGNFDLKISGKSPLVLPTKQQIDEMKKRYVIVETPKEEEVKVAAAPAAAAAAEPAKVEVKKDKLGKPITSSKAGRAK
jgi:hypothetical protein